MDDHSGPKCTTSQPPPPPTVVQHRPGIIPDVSSPTNEAPLAILNLDDNYSSSEKAYIEAAGLITADHSARRHKKTLKKPIQNLTDLPELHTFNHYDLLSPLTKNGTDCPSCFLCWMLLLQLKSSTLFYQLHYGIACSKHEFVCPAASSWAREGAAAFLAASNCPRGLSLATNSNSYESYWSSSWEILPEG